MNTKRFQVIRNDEVIAEFEDRKEMIEFLAHEMRRDLVSTFTIKQNNNL